jgi:hypothetical protein
MFSSQWSLGHFVSSSKFFSHQKSSRKLPDWLFKKHEYSWNGGFFQSCSHSIWRSVNGNNRRCLQWWQSSWFVCVPPVTDFKLGPFIHRKYDDSLMTAWVLSSAWLYTSWRRKSTISKIIYHWQYYCFHFEFVPPFLAHLSWKLKWAILITFCPSSVCLSVCKLLHFRLLLQNRWANFNQTWHKLSLGGGDSSLFKRRGLSLSKGR